MDGVEAVSNGGVAPSADIQLRGGCCAASAVRAARRGNRFLARADVYQHRRLPVSEHADPRLSYSISSRLRGGEFALLRAAWRPARRCVHSRSRAAASVACLANTVYGENYIRLPMRHSWPEGGCEYAWRYGGRWNRLYGAQFGSASNLAPGSHEEFIAEHYWGYSRRSAAATVEYRVEHPLWRVQSCGLAKVEGSVANLYPREFEFLGERPPDTAFLADGSAVAVFPWRELRS